jgi:hypothetical protein
MRVKPDGVIIMVFFQECRSSFVGHAAMQSNDSSVSAE